MWRTISFVERVEVEYSGNIFNQAILLGDLDNDKVIIVLEMTGFSELLSIRTTHEFTILVFVSFFFLRKTR